MKILLLGANGQLGRSFLEHGGLAARGHLMVTTRDGNRIEGHPTEIADLSKPDTLPVLLNRLQPQLIVNTAAYTAVDRAEQEGALAIRINGEAVGILGDWATAHDALMVHYSTDYVFDGQALQPYAVDAPTDPLGAYGRSKLAGEQALRASGAAHLILRTAWVYAAHSNNFLRTMLRIGAERDELRVVADQYGAPTSTGLIVRATLAALDAWQQASLTLRQQLQGTHHLVASGHTSWHGFATAIFDAAKAHDLIAHKPRLVPIGTAEFPTLAKRPAWSVLDNNGFEQHFGYSLPKWQDGLHDVIQTLSTQVR